MASGDCQLDSFAIRPDVKGTMQQMLQSLMNRMKQGQGEGGSGGGGAGGGGTSPNGYATQGQMNHRLPVYGPERTEFGGADLAYGDFGDGKGKSRRKNQVKVNTALEGPDNTMVAGSSQETVNIPEKYKKAVKTYFTE